MDKKTLLRLIEWGIALGACAYLVYKMVTFDDYSALWASLRAMDGRQWLAIVICVALMPLNMTLEAWRWKTLLPMSWREAHRQVYYSKLAGLITPWRLGEYPARALLQGEWKQTLSMGVVGSATMTAAIIIAGVVALGFSPTVLALLGNSYLYALAAIIVVLAALLAALSWFVGPSTLRLTVGSPSADRRWNKHIIYVSIGQSFVRLACWCVQLGLVLWAVDGLAGEGISGLVDEGMSGLAGEGISGLVAKLFVYYLFVTITPNVPIAEIGVRGAWAIAVFGSMNAALAGVLLWVINTLLPCLIWPFLRKNE